MKIYAGIFLFLFSGFAYAQTTSDSIIRFQSMAYSLCVTNNEQLFIATRAGELAQSPAINEPWRFLLPQKNIWIILHQSEYSSKQVFLIAIPGLFQDS